MNLGLNLGNPSKTWVGKPAKQTSHHHCRTSLVGQRLKLWQSLILVWGVLLLVSWGSLTWASQPAWAETTSGPQLFDIHCAGCHPGGGNIIRRGKSLKLKALQKNQMDSPAAIATIITQGKANMSAYGDRLSPEEIQQLANYVWEQAQAGWKS